MPEELFIDQEAWTIILKDILTEWVKKDKRRKFFTGDVKEIRSKQQIILPFSISPQNSDLESLESKFSVYGDIFEDPTISNTSVTGYDYCLKITKKVETNRLFKEAEMEFKKENRWNSIQIIFLIIALNFVGYYLIA